MKRRRLVLLRHAEAMPPELGQHDHERALRERGRLDAVAMGSELSGQGWAPDLALVSTAARTQQTWALAATRIETSVAQRDEPALYGATFGTLQALLGAVAEDAQTVWMVGHNPGIETAAAWWSGELVRLRTAEAALLSVAAPSWRAAGEQLGRWLLHALVRPAWRHEGA